MAAKQLKQAASTAGDKRTKTGPEKEKKEEAVFVNITPKGEKKGISCAMVHDLL